MFKKNYLSGKWEIPHRISHQMGKGLRRRQSAKPRSDRASANVQANFTLRRVRRQKFANCVTGGIKGSVEKEAEFWRMKVGL